MGTLQAVILAIVEGLTEYLPISSTGHLILTSSLMGIADQPFTKDFTIIVQFGAILSVLAVYWRRFIASREIYLKLFVAFLPAAVLGLLIKNKIDALLDSVTVVATTLIVGGVILLFVDRWFKSETDPEQPAESPLKTLNYKQAGFIGMSQCLAFVPGVSRSAASIVGGLSMGLTRASAAEFSFLLAVPTLTAATAFKMLKLYKTIEPHQVSILLIGNAVSFVVGFLAIKGFIRFLTRRGFFLFGVYRIAVGLVILILLAMGHKLEVP